MASATIAAVPAACMGTAMNLTSFAIKGANDIEFGSSTATKPSASNRGANANNAGRKASGAR